MLMAKMVEVGDARVAALSVEAFRLVLEARGWTPAEREQWREPGIGNQPWWHINSTLLHPLARLHHNGSTFDAFVEVERVQALLGAVEAAERGEWDAFGEAEGTAGAVVVRICVNGRVTLGGFGVHPRLSPRWTRARDRIVPRAYARLWAPADGAKRDVAAREARAQLPRLVRIICGVGGE